MSAVLRVDIEHRHAGGPVIAARLEVDVAAFPAVVVLGPSGAGKTTLLRCLAGLEAPQRGRIDLGGEKWLDAERGWSVPARRRRVGYVMQEPALFPHMSARANVAFGARSRGDGDVERRTARAMEVAGLDGLGERRVRELSGGEAQRVALARAIASEPRLMLLDEPLASLDSASRARLRTELRRIVLASRVPAVLVTHDRDEALTLGDFGAVMIEGRIRQSGPIAEVFSRPADEAVAGAVGVETVVPGMVETTAAGLSTVAVGSARLVAVNERRLAGPVLVCIRAADVTLAAAGAPTTSARTRLEGRVTAVARGVPMTQVTLECGFALRALITTRSCDELQIREGAEVEAMIKAPCVHLVARGPA